ncbi:MAG: 2-phospho-L-lactate guanylyltransferase [Acidimicrobiales bacterium]
MQRGQSATASAAVVMPVKAFTHGKLRLAPSLDPSARAALARAMATVVAQAASPLPLIVVCDDEEVRNWAATVGAEALWTPGVGLNGAVEAGVAHLATRAIDRAIVAHADLPFARTLEWVADFDGVTLVPDRHGDGTNVICVPTTVGFQFSYGAASSARHQGVAKALDLPTRVVPDDRLGWDVDVPTDLHLPPDLDLPPELADLLRDRGAAPITVADRR